MLNCWKNLGANPVADFWLSLSLFVKVCDTRRDFPFSALWDSPPFFLKVCCPLIGLQHNVQRLIGLDPLGFSRQFSNQLVAPWLERQFHSSSLESTPTSAWTTLSSHDMFQHFYLYTSVFNKIANITSNYLKSHKLTDSLVFRVTVCALDVQHDELRITIGLLRNLNLHL